jgi:hypothetical protein
VSGSEKKIALLYDRVTIETYSHSSPVHTQYSKTSLQLKILEVDFAPLDKPVLFEPDPERGVVPPVDRLIVRVLKSGISAGPPRIIAPSVGYVAPGSSCTRIRDVA